MHPIAQRWELGNVPARDLQFATAAAGTAGAAPKSLGQ
jgi:hypothetical protein